MSSRKTEIHTTENYNKHFEYKKYCEYANSYITLISNFLSYTGENVLIQNNSYYIFVMKRGLETISHIFRFLLMYTKNIFLTLHHCKKSFFYYVEFIGQIGDDNHSYLQLNSRDAMLFVFKKTIFDINSKYRQNFIVNTKEDTEYLHFFFLLTTFLNDLVLYCLQKKITDFQKNLAIKYCIDMPLKIIHSIYNPKDSIHKSVSHVNSAMNFSQILKTKVSDLDRYISILRLFCKKNRKKSVTIRHIKMKFSNSKIDDIFIKYTPLKIVNWIMNK